MRVILFANGTLKHEERVKEIIRPGDVILAADGGARHCLRLNLVPEQVIGDFDSLSEAEIDQLQAAGATISRHPRRKDETDLELALCQAMERHPEAILIFGALGARWDMSFSNLLLLAEPKFSGPTIQLLHGHQTISLLRSGQTLTLEGQPGDTVSLIPLRGDANGITTQGLEYALSDGTLRFGASRGVSNVMQAERANVQLDQGLLVVVQIQKGAMR